MSAHELDDHRLDHIVVLMFENRSFDNLLGYLYGPSEVPRFEGLAGRSLTNPIPAGFQSSPGTVIVHPASSMASPYPDPGEEFPHVNTQLFSVVDPPSNRFSKVEEMQAPYNAPAANTPPAMQGFVEDYVSAFRVEMDRMPSVQQYSQIMGCFTPGQIPVLSGLARGFACFDRWFCEVPSQTYTNRSFFHAASSSGYVLNGHPPGKFSLHNDAETIFNRLEAVRKSWAVYIDPLQFVSATGLIHAPRLAEYFPTHFRTIYDFYFEAREGSLPNYAFIEPNMFHPHTDMHPHSGAKWTEKMGLRPPDTLIGGERLLASVYDVIRTSSPGGESNWRNTALVVTFDEHGGTYDHVPPPAVPPLVPDGGEQGFKFDRLGVRIPTLLISAWVDARSVVQETFRSTSVIRTLRDWWDLGPPLTARDADSPSLLPVLSRASPRSPDQWPKVVPRAAGVLERLEEEFLRRVENLESPPERLERDLLGDALAHEGAREGRAPVADSETVEHREAHRHFQRVGAKYFPGVAQGRMA